MRAVVAVIANITPDPRATMCRAAARAVRNCALIAVVIGREKSSNGISSSGVPWTSPWLIALKDTSMPPAFSATASACPSTASSSSASTRAVSASPPAAAISSATCSSVARVRPARNTFAPSRAKARATAPPTDPPPP